MESDELNKDIEEWLSVPVNIDNIELDETEQSYVDQFIDSPILKVDSGESSGSSTANVCPETSPSLELENGGGRHRKIPTVEEIVDSFSDNYNFQDLNKIKRYSKEIRRMILKEGKLGIKLIKYFSELCDE